MAAYVKKIKPDYYDQIERVDSAERRRSTELLADSDGVGCGGLGDRGRCADGFTKHA
jgi:hypothetical protein